MTRARDLASLGDNTTKLEQQGLVQVVASSVTKGASGSASVDSKGTITFSGTESIALNGVFTSTYQNYRLFVNITLQSANADFNARLRVSNADNSVADYSYSGLELPTGGSVTLDAAAGTTLWKLGENYNNYDDFMGISIDLLSPQASSNTKFNSQTFGGTTAGAFSTYIFSGVFNAPTSFDSINFYPASGTVTGTIRVYGYNQ
jgi:hypothetical protein